MSKKHKKHHKSDRDSDAEKPGLKLVLKVGTPDRGSNTPPPVEHDGERKHKHKKKKKKHKHYRDEQDPEFKVKVEKRKSDSLKEMEISDVDEEIAIPPVKKQATEPALSATIIAGRNLRERKSNEDEQTPLQRCLDYLHKILVRKDVNGFFAYPVTDNIAPSYSKIISHPMDMSTMKEKIDNNQYATLLDYKADFKLMCDNCMTYNHPDTIYYKEAEKLLKSGLKLMSKEKMFQLKRTMPFMAMVTDHELGADQDQSLDGSTGADSALKQSASKPKVKKPTMSRFEAFPDRLTPEQILAQAQDAAKEAKEQLQMKKPNTKFGFLRKQEDGTTTLNLLNPDNDGIVSEKERVVNLGSLIGKLQSGTGMMSGFKEDKRNKALPVNYLNYGPYSSYAPVYDSSNANLSKEDSDLLLSAYADEAGIQYAYSICHFVKDSGDYAVRMVDNLLDIITGGDHSKARAVLEKIEEAEKEDIPEETNIKAEPDERKETLDDANVDFSALRSLSELGIDVGFVDSLENELKQEREIQEKLDKTSDLLKDLQETQYERLSRPLPQHLAHVKGPDEKETELAKKVALGLKDLAKQVNPGVLASTSALHQSLGIGIVSETESPSAEETSKSTDGPTVAAADTTTEDIGTDEVTAVSTADAPTNQQQQEQPAE